MRVGVVAIVALTLGCCACGTSTEKPKPKPRVRVPNLVGLTWEAAADRLAGAGLCMKATQPFSTPPTRPDRVLRQTPRAGATIEVHGRVSIVVSPSGPSGAIVSYSVRGCRGATEYVIVPGG
jgi:beta-lactam-binding protein with PASTA domain